MPILQTAKLRLQPLSDLSKVFQLLDQSNQVFQLLDQLLGQSNTSFCIRLVDTDSFTAKTMTAV